LSLKEILLCIIYLIINKFLVGIILILFFTLIF
jgi:hypothetical protein